MTKQFMSLDEIFKQQEAENASAMEASLAKHDAHLAQRRQQKEVTPVWMASPDKIISGPYKNEDAAIAHAESQHWDLEATVIDVSEKLVRSQLEQIEEAQKEADNDDDDDDVEVDDTPSP